jgi:hypothetical protein
MQRRLLPAGEHLDCALHPHHGGMTHVSSGLVAQLLGHVHWLHICFGQEATILHVCMHIIFGQTGAYLHGIKLFSVIDSQRQQKQHKSNAKYIVTGKPG